ncbi:DUF4230 domain-containing protein [Apibacter sp.]|uniref:DUF4230 domain-containing protein n=1 Tax=Apibacter sp. TaxID=2023709 RepID=UPI0025DBCF19|nr:DUF4230 domain-containing protein [Apibacter sp.]MCT6868998.1 DUF4230 domain-containing protein [Apibacter sp.]
MVIFNFLKKYFLSILFLILGLLAFIFILKKSGKENVRSETKIINHEIQRLNKMIVIEQNFSSFKTKKYNNFNPKYFDFLNKNIVLYITAMAQVTYDMKKIKIDVDSTSKTVHIIFIPEPELKVYPDVEIYSMETGFLNNFSKSELNEVMEESKKDITNEVEKSNIKALAKTQLISNLKELYKVVKLNNWKIIDDTPYANQLNTIKD